MSAGAQQMALTLDVPAPPVHRQVAARTLRPGDRIQRRDHTGAPIGVVVIESATHGWIRWCAPYGIHRAPSSQPRVYVTYRVSTRCGKTWVGEFACAPHADIEAVGEAAERAPRPVRRRPLGRIRAAHMAGA